MKITRKTTIGEIIEMLEKDSSIEANCQSNENKEFSLKNIMEITDDFIENRKSEIFKELAEEISLTLAHMKITIEHYNKHMEKIKSEIPENTYMFGYTLKLCENYYKAVEKAKNLEVESLDSYRKLKTYISGVKAGYSYVVKGYTEEKLNYLLNIVVKLVNNQIITRQDVNNIFIFKDAGENEYYFDMIYSTNDISIVYEKDNKRSGRYHLSHLKDIPEAYTKAVTALENFLKETMNLK